MDVFLETERLILRRFTAEDLDPLIGLDGDPEVMRYLTGGTPTPPAVIAGRTLPRFLRSYDPFPGFGYWAAVEKATGAFLGWFSFRPREGAGVEEVELGYRLRRAAWGQGYATEGSRALIRKGFTELGVERVVATTFAANLASRRVMEKAGLTLVRTFRLTPADLMAQETYCAGAADLFEGDDLEYALERAVWEQAVG
jgi:RimJ/RimL family protein N-acetyltransferase